MWTLPRSIGLSKAKPQRKDGAKIRAERTQMCVGSQQDNQKEIYAEVKFRWEGVIQSKLAHFQPTT